MINLLIILLLTTTSVTRSNYVQSLNGFTNSDYEEDINEYALQVVSEEEDDVPVVFRLNRQLELKCPNVSNEFFFKEIRFNQSLSDLKSLLTLYYKYSDDYEIGTDFVTIKSDFILEQLFRNVQKINVTDKLMISKAKYSDSGHYYCVYSNNANQFIVKSYLFVVYDEELLRKNLNDNAELKPCIDQENEKTSDLVWKIDGSSVKTDNKTLQINLNDISMFDSIYRCQNVETGAYKVYTIECLNREILYPEPSVTPTRQTVPIGSETKFTCDKYKTESREPDRYQWFMEPLQDTTITTQNDQHVTVFNLDLRKTIGDGSILELSNITNNDSGWYICCLFYRKERQIDSSDIDPDNEESLASNYDRLKDSFEHSCSSAELIVNDASKQKVLSFKTKVLIVLIILVSCLILIVGICFLAYYGYSKYFTYLKTVKAAQTMQKNDFYQSSGQDSSGRPLNAFSLDSKFDHFKQILTTSSSIESLLNKDDIKKWRIPIKDLTFGHVIGRGAFGVVMYGELKKKQIIALSTHSIKRNCTDTDSGLDSEVYVASHTKPSGTSSVVVTKNMSVAVKKLPENATSENFLDLFKELNLMFQVGQHAHIINLIGYSIEESSLHIITDYARHGNLKDFLRKHDEMNKSATNDTIIGADTLLLYSYQIALGMQYLHSKKVLHRDLAARNILVDDYDSIKIADFGLARNIRTDYYYVQQREGKMPLKWMSPEALSFNRISNESDIWSYGILLWEIFTYGSTPYPSIQAENILANLNSGYRMEKPNDCDQYIYDEIILNCWRLEPKKRPTFAQLVDLFNTSEYLNIKGLISVNKTQEICDQTSQSTKVTNASNSDCSLNLTTVIAANIPEQTNTTEENKDLNSSSNFLSTSSSSSYNPSSSTSSVNSPGHAYMSTSSIFYEETILNEKLLSKKNSNTSSSNEMKLIKENNKTMTRIKTPKSAIRKFAYRTNDRKNSFSLARNFTRVNDDIDDYDEDEDDSNDYDEKKLFHRYNLLSEKSNFINKNITSTTNNNNSKNSNNSLTASGASGKKKFLLTYV